MELNLKENKLEEIIGQAQYHTYKEVKNSIIDTDDIKEDSKESYIRIMRNINIEDWNIWLKEEKENSYTGLVALELLGESYSTAIEINAIEKIMDELFGMGGEVECIGNDIHKFYIDGRLIYTVSSL